METALAETTTAWKKLRWAASTAFISRNSARSSELSKRAASSSEGCIGSLAPVCRQQPPPGRALAITSRHLFDAPLNATPRHAEQAAGFHLRPDLTSNTALLRTTASWDNMSKQQEERPAERPSLHLQRRRGNSSSRIGLAVLLGLLIYYSSTIQGTWFPLRSAKPTAAQPQDWDEDDIWKSIKAGSKLDYTPCYQSAGDFHCARLELPMDYWNGTTDESVSIAIVKKPAPVPVTSPHYGGAVLHNPGGPGGSGVYFLLRAVDHLQATVGSPEGLQYDHISFDPRGIGHTLPRVECFDDDRAMILWQTRLAEEGVYSSSDAAFGRLWSMAAASAGSCSLPPEDGSADIKQYVNTAFVARDMLEIVEAHGQWRGAEAKRLLQRSGCKGKSASADAAAALEKLKYRPGEEKINYWGFSYGTYLGNTFAAMFPDRINRLVVDGVVDAYDYRKTLWLDNLKDTERELNQFYYHCARVGHPKCALANRTEATTSEGVKARVDSILSRLYHNPLPHISRNHPDVLTYSDVKGLLFASLYSPLTVFPIAATILDQIDRAMDEVGGPNQNLRMATLLVQGATEAIACTDGESLAGTSRENFREHLHRLEKLSPSLGEIWAPIHLSCVHYKMRAHYRFTGDWTGNTSHPILEVGNTADPVTPGRYAKKMAKGFKGAVALIEDGPGHCSSGASNCTNSYIRQYFQTGELPAEGTVCPVDELPFDNPRYLQGQSHDDMFALRATDRRGFGSIRDAVYASGGGYGARVMPGGL